MPVPWNPNHPAVFVEPPTGLPVSLVRHDGYPYEEVWDEAGTGWSGLFDIANRYLARANTRLQLPPEWLADLLGNPSISTLPETALYWLKDSTDPRHSYWVTRQAGLDAPSRPRTGTVLDRTAVLLAGLWFAAPTMSAPTPLFGGQGLRILIQTGPSAAQNLIRITSVASTLPQPPVERMSASMLEHTAERIAMTFGLPEEVEVVDVGVRLPSEHEKQSPIIFAKTAILPNYADDDHPYEETSYLLVMRANDKFPNRLEPLAQRPLIASADADLFVQDPISRNGAKHFTRLRPSRSSVVLDPERVNTPLGNLPAGSGPNVQLVDPDPHVPADPDFWVTDSRLVDPPLVESATKEVAPSASVLDHVRTNTFAAVNAFYHTSDLFRRLRQYGLSPADYFKFVERPIDVRYRAGIVPGYGDGRTVNAQVRWTLRPDSGGAPSKGTIEVRFALGDLESAVGRLPANMPSAVEKSPLGVASDPRWCWHEYSHVLITAAVGDLEFRFAHSAGDALAAILSDPASQLANDENATLANDGPWRGVTFPWVLIPRRHDRAARDGWSWTGPLYQREVYFVVPGLSDKRGYWAEQILSSSLFRLYRAIGGDSQTLSGAKPIPAVSERQKAADYCAYLIMRTIQSLGSAAVVPSTSPGQFAELMRNVETATATAPGPGGYVGGMVHKVVRWAFERQGLSGTPEPTPTVSGADEVATVDLHIEDLRPKLEGPYSPVDLLGSAWHADPNFLKVKKVLWWTWIRVTVQNRGVVAAPNTRVDVWCAPVVAGVIPDFPDTSKWKPVGSKTATVPGRTGSTPGAKTFGWFSWTPPNAPQEYAILAAASCDADLSNIDPATKHPCVSVASPINILVACDNNLGLMTVMIT